MIGSVNDGNILSVTELTGAIRNTVETAFPFVWVRGQVSNLSRPTSGHLYFSLKDEESSLAAVWFKNSQKAGEAFDPLTGEVYEDGPRPNLAQSLDNGQEVVCAGRIAVYGARGIYQLVVEIAQKAGLGRLHEEFTLLRAKLEALGYFARERKRSLPPHPCRVAVITAPQGAAIQDFLRIAHDRGLAAQIRIYSAPVQGEGAPPKLAAALNRINADGWADVAVLIRGGGSLEDLWAFNDEKLAETIFHSRIPVLAGIGHEVDFTLADLTADVRAATPTHAAQLLWPERLELLRGVLALESELMLAGKRCLEKADSGLRGLARDLDWRSPRRLLGNWRQNLNSAARFLRSAGQLLLEREYARLTRFSAALTPVSAKLPAHSERLGHLEENLERSFLRYLENTEAGLQKSAVILERAPERLPMHEAHFNKVTRQLEAAGGNLLFGLEHFLERSRLHLEACNPLAPLERGYALVRKENGTFVKKTSDALPGENLNLVVQDGEIPVLVREHPAKEASGD